jgi:hypothetical protein
LYHRENTGKMAQKEAKNPTFTTKNSNADSMNMEGLVAIRDILMGQHIAESNERFAALEALMAEKEAAAQVAQAQRDADMNARFDKLEQLLQQNTGELRQQLQQTSQSDKHSMADLFVELSKKLKN